MFDSIKDRLTDKQGTDLEALRLFNYYRNTYGTEEGLSVLENQLKDLMFFSEIETDEEMALRNAGIRLLARLGIIRPSNTRAIVDALMKLPIKLT